MIKIETTVQQTIDVVWDHFNNPEHIIHWNTASTDDWHCPFAKNDLRVGGSFNYRMESRDGSEGFDFSGIYNEILMREKLVYTLDDARKVIVTFEDLGNQVRVQTEFDVESVYPLEAQRAGWQSILDNFATYSNSKK